MSRVNTLRNAYEFIVTFLESMVESTVDVQKENQTLLRSEKQTPLGDSIDIYRYLFYQHDKITICIRRRHDLRDFKFRRFLRILQRCVSISLCSFTVLEINTRLYSSSLSLRTRGILRIEVL